MSCSLTYFFHIKQEATSKNHDIFLDEEENETDTVTMPFILTGNDFIPLPISTINGSDGSLKTSFHTGISTGVCDSPHNQKQKERS